MRMFVFSLFALLGALVAINNSAIAQVENPVRWSFNAKKIDDRTFEVWATATIAEPWHIYSQDSNGNLSRPTEFSFKNNPLVELVGKPRENGSVEKEDVDGSILKYFRRQVQFIQTVKLKPGIKAKTNLSGQVGYMACTDGHCLPEATRTFSISLDGTAN
ncbi:thiol:disulfide interchange protein DsbD [Chitinophaga terrae (ex Kim and Jung 2007)]|uniref:protein-disulfide reductase DsbD domain-containing protein n=1 Tax=Chitinophaga terrae (ex Kim and Jung 2007) TaxID=408074 RepID=UPI002783190C|nr:protein-disulfide reductase DsbD domain-containing protein [Chitinophaga terrae (ex Kim and Jung 2007)]MDQ0107516.1 thiol:disulfide interchange protein DsbD [Chitinophaga terrae (ex Kim and Jung 2007)]